jgi:hypothetical protein
VKRQQLILLMLSRHIVSRCDLEALAERVRRQAPEIDVVVTTRHRAEHWRLLPQALRPTLTVVFGPLRKRVWAHGQILDCPKFAKHVELAKLRAAGVPVPDFAVIEPGTRLDPGVWGPYTVVKPTLGARGAEVRIRKTARVRFEAPEAFPPEHPIRKGPLIAQRFVYTGPWAVSYRVCTFFGRALYCWRVEQSHAKRRLEGRWDFHKGSGGVQIIAPSLASTYTLSDDAELIAVAERAHRLAFPDYPYLGFDLVRDAETGEVSVLEANSGGKVLHLSSVMGMSVQREHGIDFYRQLGALERAAERLIEVTRRRARIAPLGRRALARAPEAGAFAGF